MKGKRKHRFYPSPREFRTALHQTIVDTMFVQIKSQNCKEDIAAFLFSLDQVPSVGDNISEDSRLRRDVPKSLRPLMSVPPKSIDMTLEEENVMIAIARVQENISPFLQRIWFNAADMNGSIQPTAHIFRANQFNACAHEGLKAPLFVLFSTCTDLKNSFRIFRAQNIHSEGIRAFIVAAYVHL
ncbi:hypothetical protein PoB_005441500 [Plakobranchus ocellatus]|uniref:Uncharacterized protein n=1 Tax=Plakobranchus ocellatus TaxID=259542 RepID=A0AAV4C5C4_9GAST|nr:hypothetical protein PoB_005441500 [Plakobranchus ocellatus]